MRGEAHHSGFGGTILGHVVGPEPHSPHRRDVDDRTASAPFHGANAEVDAQHRAPEVEVDGTSPMRGITLRKIRFLDAASIVHQHVQTAKFLFGKGDHPRHVNLGSHLGENESRPSSPGSDLTNGTSTSLLVHVCDHDGRTFTCQPQCYRSSDPGTSPCHEGHLLFEIHYAVPPSWCP